MERFAINSKLSVSGELWLQSNTTLAGTSYFEVAGLMVGVITGSNNASLTLVATREYIVTSYIRHYGARSGVAGTILSATPGSKALLTVRQGASQIIGYVNVTDIDSSNGITLRSYEGTFSNCTNWLKLNQEYSLGGSF